MSEAKVLVGEKEYRVIKSGRAQAEQVVAVTRWISRHGTRALKVMQSDGEAMSGSGIEFLGKFVEALDADALIGLFQALTGCSQEEAELYFDIATLVDVAFAVYEGQPSVRRLIDRFFSTPKSEQPSDELSTKSG